MSGGLVAQNRHHLDPVAGEDAHVRVAIEQAGGGLGWEAHIGGFLFGLLAMPWLAPRTPPPATC